MRTLVIGDIHGALKALIQCLDRADYNPIHDKLIFLGDYVDGWSESSQLIEYLIDLQKSASISSVSPEMIIFLRGNHDKWCEDWLIKGQSPINWTEQGGKSTIESYIKTGYLTKDSHRDFFKHLKNYYIDHNNKAFVHGGFISDKGLGHEEYEADYYWDRSLWERKALCGSLSQMPKILKLYNEIYIGHTATVNWKTDQPMNKCNVWNLDTGCGFTGRLTIMDVDTKEYWQSDLSKELYPNDHGR